MRNRIFNTIKGSRVRRNAFNLSHEKKLSMNMADLVPIYLQEVLPGDKFRLSTECVIRLAPQIAPVMHRVNVYTHYFFVPNRLVYANWQKFITGGVDGKQAPPFPTLTIDPAYKQMYAPGSLGDYFGMPTIDQTETPTSTMKVSALPFRAYQKIYNEYYRDQTLTTEIPVLDTDTVTESLSDLMSMRKRQWQKDYFTSALPNSQRGDNVLVPTTLVYKEPAGGLIAGSDMPSASGAVSISGGVFKDSGNVDLTVDNIEGMEATINDLRKSIRLQEWLEKNARAGSRYIEQILAHFNVMTPDYRLQRPEYLGGGQQPVVFSEVLANFGSVEIPQGNMAGHGISIGQTNQFKKFFSEHGYVIGIMSVLPSTCYQQGLDKQLTKGLNGKFDFAFPEFANIGEQPIDNQELYFDFFDSTDQYNPKTFGYTPRYAEYKFKNSSVHGDFKSTLNFWHMGRIFETNPQLNNSFTEADPSERIFAVDDNGATHKLYVQLYNNVHAIRPLPVYGTPLL